MKRDIMVPKKRNALLKRDSSKCIHLIVRYYDPVYTVSQKKWSA